MDEFLAGLLPDGQSLEEALEEQQSDISNPTDRKVWRTTRGGKRCKHRMKYKHTCTARSVQKSCPKGRVPWSTPELNRDGRPRAYKSGATDMMRMSYT